MKIGFLGAGAMGGAILSGAINAAFSTPSRYMYPICLTR